MANLTQDRTRRKQTPIATGVIDYFPLAIAAVSEVSFVGNEQHNPGTELHWDRTKSTDEADCLMRHFLERGTLDSDGLRHSAKVAWRALALLQKEIEAEIESGKMDRINEALTNAKAKSQTDVPSTAPGNSLASYGGCAMPSIQR